RRALNEHLLEAFIAKLDLSPSLIKSHPNYPVLCSYGILAAEFCPEYCERRVSLEQSRRSAAVGDG
ncbi:MAG: hypothetical protein ACKO7W_05280, partial [Elainella sp.]